MLRLQYIMEKNNDIKGKHIIYQLNSDESQSSFVDLNPLPKSRASKPPSISIDESIEIEIEQPKKVTRSLEVSEVISMNQEEEPEKEKQKCVEDCREVMDELPRLHERQQQNWKEEVRSSKSAIVSSDAPIQVQRPYSQIKPAQSLEASLTTSTERLPPETKHKTLKDIIWSGLIAGIVGTATYLFTKSKRAGAASASLAFAVSYDTFRKTQ